MTKTPLLDCAEVWDRLSPEQQRELGKAAVLFVASCDGQDDALERDDLRACRLHEVGIGVAHQAMQDALEGAHEGATVGLPHLPPADLRPFGVQQCRECGCIQEVACRGGCSWTEEDLCSACTPVMAEMAG